MRRARPPPVVPRPLALRAILALVATLGYRALSSLTDSEARLAAESSHWRNLDALFARLEADARAALPREARTDSGREPGKRPS